MSLQNIWQETFRINWYDTDSTARSKCLHRQLPTGSAWRHARHLGFGYEETRKRNEFWVIVGLMVRMIENSPLGKVRHVETWPKGIERLFASGFQDHDR